MRPGRRIPPEPDAGPRADCPSCGAKAAIVWQHADGRLPPSWGTPCVFAAGAPWYPLVRTLTADTGWGLCLNCGTEVVRCPP